MSLAKLSSNFTGSMSLLFSGYVRFALVSIFFQSSCKVSHSSTPSLARIIFVLSRGVFEKSFRFRQPRLRHLGAVFKMPHSVNSPWSKALVNFDKPIHTVLSRKTTCYFQANRPLKLFSNLRLLILHRFYLANLNAQHGLLSCSWTADFFFHFFSCLFTCNVKLEKKN